MEKEFIPWNEASALKELGFNELCSYQHDLSNDNTTYSYYEDGITNTQLDDLTYEINEENIENGDELIEPVVTAVLYQQAFRWFDETTDFRGFVVSSIDGSEFAWATIDLFTKIKTASTEFYSSRKKAELECLKELIEIGKREL